MIVLGIDPGSRFTGFGILKLEKSGDITHVFSGVLNLQSEDSIPKRLGRLQVQLVEIIEKWRPQAMSVEKIFLGKNPDSAFVLGQARGVCLALAGQFDIPVFEYATRSVKKVVTGSGAAEKEEVRLILQALLQKRFSSLDETDSLALAVCHCRQLQVDAVIEKGLKGVPL